MNTVLPELEIYVTTGRVSTMTQRRGSVGPVMARTVEDHATAVAQALASLPAIDVVRDDARGAMLAADVIAAAPVPASATAACDGYAVRAGDVASATPGAPAVLPVTHDVGFATVGKASLVPGTAARVVSGAPLPTGADAVVALVDTDGGVAHVKVWNPAASGHNVRQAGFEVNQGDVALTAGTRLSARHLAVIAAMGVRRVTVHPVPRVVVLAVGAELAEADNRRKPGTVPETTGHLIADLVRDAGAHAYRVSVPSDDHHAIRGALEDHIVRADVVITTGGLSQARHDTVAPVLEHMGEFEVSDVLLLPRARHGVGHINIHDRSVPVVALPGRPVAAFVAFEAYVRDALRAMSGHDSARLTAPAVATHSWQSVAGVEHAVLVRIEEGSNGGLRAAPVGDPLNPSLAALAAANGVAWVPASSATVKEGSVVRCHVWDS